ncbi:MAG: ATP-binding protein [Candidatus Obscuribacterales bacterium]|jgi:predicted AAA+ superfamily ATPase|nr:ATP-binding protein [Candidatus Obscuribacterales bacterium]
MISRPFWLNQIENSWQKAPIVWLTGVRRVGKSTLCQELTDALYFNCDLPRVADQLKDIEQFYSQVKSKKIILDEIHQLPDPSKILKIAADSFPKLKILATGSSTLSATQKFRDSLAGRKRVIHLLPVLASELAAFGSSDVRLRLLRGGLPQCLLSQDHDLSFYSEWLDSFYARDVQELFRIEKRSNFLKLIELLLRQSGGLIEITSLAKHAGLSRPTVMNYIEVLQITHAITLIRPFAGGGRREIVAQPKAYGFDTGFVAYARSWTELRPTDLGPLWEHLVLETLRSFTPDKEIHFWRDKQQTEIDFVIPRNRSSIDAIECKWSSTTTTTHNFKKFRANYPDGKNILVSNQEAETYIRTIEGLDIIFTNLLGLTNALKS